MRTPRPLWLKLPSTTRTGRYSWPPSTPSERLAAGSRRWPFKRSSTRAVMSCAKPSKRRWRRSCSKKILSTLLAANIWCQETVRHYLLRPIGGDPSHHDHEFDDVRWVPVQEAMKLMTYQNEARIVKDALALIQGHESETVP